jgi:glycosyltransferase involved in cell wall biosynthesis
VESLVRGRSCDFPLEIVIVDDASDDAPCGIEEAIGGASATSLKLRRLDRWSGIPAARNRGAEIADHEIYLVTDGNACFPENWDLPIRQHYRPGRILAATILDMASSFRGFGCQLTMPSMGVTWIPVPGAYGGYAPISSCAGTVIGRRLFHHLGGYDESLPLYGSAEPEFSIRAWLSGYEIVSLPGLQVRHRFRPRCEHDRFLASIAPVQLRNHLRFALYYLPDEWLARTCAHHARQHPDLFEPIWSELKASDAGARRALLAARLPRDFRWFAGAFPLLWQRGDGE